MGCESFFSEGVTWLLNDADFYFHNGKIILLKAHTQPIGGGDCVRGLNACIKSSPHNNSQSLHTPISLQGSRGSLNPPPSAP